jgi:hypothetical protein
MSIIVNIFVDDVATKIADYDQIKVYRAFSSSVAAVEITSVATRISLVDNVAYYSFTDESGHIEYLYSYSFYNSVSTAESSKSTSFYGWVPNFEFGDTSYPAEYATSQSERDIIDTIRFYIGDGKVINRDYVNPSCESLYSNVSECGTTYKLSEAPAWPVKIIKDSVEYITASEPTVYGNEYLVFSNSTISTTSGVVDVWYETFRHSDREILELYTTAPPPFPLTITDVSTAMKGLQVAIILLESEIRNLMGNISGSFSVSGDTSFNPEPLLRQKQDDLKRFRARLEEMVDQESVFGITGVRID